MQNEVTDTLAIRRTKETLRALDIPDPPSDFEFLGIRVHEVDGPTKERLLLAFGIIPLRRWLEVVNAYNANFGEGPSYAPENDDMVVNALTRLHYHRVTYKAVGNGFSVFWDARGLVPVTLWLVAPRVL